MKYIAPNKDLTAFTCPHCLAYSLMKISYHEFEEDNEYGCFGEYDIQNRNPLTVARCANCGGKILWIKDQYIYPDMQPIEANADMPDSVKQLYVEAGLIHTKSPRAACALLRLAIERLCNELEETDRDINKNIAALVKRGLSVEVQQALDIVRVVGNKAVHPGQIAFDVDNVETANTLFYLINYIVDKLISEPRKLEEFYSNLPQNVLDAIKNRDK